MERDPDPNSDDIDVKHFIPPDMVGESSGSPEVVGVEVAEANNPDNPDNKHEYSYTERVRNASISAGMTPEAPGAPRAGTPEAGSPRAGTPEASGKAQVSFAPDEGSSSSKSKPQDNFKKSIFIILFIFSIMANVLLLSSDVYDNVDSSSKNYIKYYTNLIILALSATSINFSRLAFKDKEPSTGLQLSLLCIIISGYLYILLGSVRKGLYSDDSIAFGVFILISVCIFIFVFFWKIIYKNKDQVVKYKFFIMFLVFGLIIGILILLSPPTYEGASMSQKYYTDTYTIIILIGFLIGFFVCFWNFWHEDKKNISRGYNFQLMLISFAILGYIYYTYAQLGTSVRSGILESIGSFIIVALVIIIVIIIYYIYKLPSEEFQFEYDYLTLGCFGFIILAAINCTIFMFVGFFNYSERSKAYISLYLWVTTVGILATSFYIYVKSEDPWKGLFPSSVGILIGAFLVLISGITDIFRDKNIMQAIAFYIITCTLIIGYMVYASISVYRYENKIAERLNEQKNSSSYGNLDLLSHETVRVALGKRLREEKVSEEDIKNIRKSQEEDRKKDQSYVRFDDEDLDTVSEDGQSPRRVSDKEIADRQRRLYFAAAKRTGIGKHYRHLVGNTDDEDHENQQDLPDIDDDDIDDDDIYDTDDRR